MPAPGLVQLSLPELAFALAISSGMVLISDCAGHHEGIGRGADHHDRGEILVRIVGDVGVEARVDHENARADEQRIAVGRRRALTAAIPMLPPAPPRFSIITGLPRASPSWVLISLAAMSVPPPAGKHTDHGDLALRIFAPAAPC